MTRRLQVILLIAFSLIWFSNLEYRKLVNPDEGRYAEIAREMVASGDWTTPRLNDIKYFEKPALQYWATATAYTLFGEHQWTARLWSALTGFLGVIMVFLAGRRLFGEETGWNAALVLASSLLWVLIAHVNTLDMGVSFFLSAAICAFVLAQQDGVGARTRLGWMLASWAALALAVLSKGLIGLILPAAALAAYTLIERDWSLPGRSRIFTGIVQVGVRLVQHHQARPAVERAGQADALLLASRQPYVELAQRRLVALRQAQHHIVHGSGTRSADHLI